MITLTDEDVSRLLSMDEAIEIVENSFARFSEGKVIQPLRTRIGIGKEGNILVMLAFVEPDAFATKVVSVYRKNKAVGLPTTSATVVVNDPHDGRTLGVLEATNLTAIRTGAASGVATKYLSGQDARTLCVIGCGFQARTQALAVSRVRKLEKIYGYDRSASKTEKFLDEIVKVTGAEGVVSESPRTAVEQSDIIVTATTSSTPVLARSWLKAGCHVNAIGAYTPSSRELDSQTIRDAKLVVDSREAALSEAGDILIPIEEKMITANHIYAELGDIVIGKKPGRQNEAEITVFKSLGQAFQDAATAAFVLAKAVK